MKIMRLLALAGSLCLASTALAGELLPDGHFEGSGRWSGPENSSGSYDVETVIEQDVIKSTYRYDGAQPGRDRHAVRMAPRNDGSFDVATEEGKVVGQGYCLEDECFYRMEVSGVVIEENLRVADRQLIKFGSKSGAGFRVVWKETLELR